MHHQVCIGYPSVDLFYPIDCENVSRWWPGKLVGTMRGANRNRQRIYLRDFDKVSGLIRVG